jgi:hypothetical protein
MTDQVERIDVDGRPPEPQLSAWQDWFRRHGIDPNYVPATNSIERRPDANQIVCDMYDMHEGCECGRCDGVFTTGRIVEQQVFQLEGPPLPFPQP